MVLCFSLLFVKSLEYHPLAERLILIPGAERVGDNVGVESGKEVEYL